MRTFTSNTSARSPAFRGRPDRSRATPQKRRRSGGRVARRTAARACWDLRGLTGDGRRVAPTPARRLPPPFPCHPSEPEASIRLRRDEQQCAASRSRSRSDCTSSDWGSDSRRLVASRRNSEMTLTLELVVVGRHALRLRLNGPPARRTLTLADPFRTVSVSTFRLCPAIGSGSPGTDALC